MTDADRRAQREAARATLRAKLTALRDRLFAVSNQLDQTDSDMIQGAKITERAISRELDALLREDAPQKEIHKTRVEPLSARIDGQDLPQRGNEAK